MRALTREQLKGNGVVLSSLNRVVRIQTFVDNAGIYWVPNRCQKMPKDALRVQLGCNLLL